MTSTPTRLQGLREESMDKCDGQEEGYDYATLHTWVQRPASTATCFIKDVYALRAVIPAAADRTTYMGRGGCLFSAMLFWLTSDVFMLDHWPCRTVQLVGWVAGVDHKEKAMVVTLDDGDGYQVLPVTVFLSLQSTGAVSATRQSEETTSDQTFLTARQRGDRRRIATQKEEEEKKGRPLQGYMRRDVRVGDTVRVTGRVNEYPRRRAGGEAEWVREVIVDEASGETIGMPYEPDYLLRKLKADVADEEDQWAHNARVADLHARVYSKSFVLPSIPPAIPVTVTSRPHQESIEIVCSSPGTTFSELASSEIGECYGVRNEVVKLRDPSKLRSSQLTDSTYRQYILDYMTQETLAILDDLAFRGSIGPPPICSSRALHHRILSSFPESSPSHSRRGRCSKSPFRSLDPILEPFSITDLLETPHLSHLARLIVDHVTRQEEKRRRRRIRDGNSRPSDLKVEAERKLTGRDWRLTDRERESRVLRLTTWVIRNLHEDGAVVHLKDGFVPLCPEVLYPVLVPLIEREEYLRDGTFMRKDDPRKHNGVMVEEILSRLTRWGEEGRWERMRSWVVADAMVWAEGQGFVKKRGKGWDLVERD